MNGKEKQVCDYLEEKRDDIIRLLQDLVSKESVNPPGDTRGAAQVILDKLGEYRIPCQEIVSNEVHKSLLATIGEGKQNLLFNAHIDTVPVGDLQKWSAPAVVPQHQVNARDLFPRYVDFLPVFLECDFLRCV